MSKGEYNKSHKLTDEKGNVPCDNEQVQSIQEQIDNQSIQQENLLENITYSQQSAVVGDNNCVAQSQTNEQMQQIPTQSQDVDNDKKIKTMRLRESKVWHFVKGHAVLVIAIVLALVTCIFVPFDKQYANYFDWRTLTCLFCTLAVVTAFKNIRFFEWLADKIVRKFGSVRSVVIALVFITYVGSMIMANDMALITFLPLGFFVMQSCNQKKYLAFTFIMQNIAANLGGMLTPFGNPQNLYMYSFFNIPTGEFFAIMALPFAVAFVLILAVCFFVKPDKVTVYTDRRKTPSLWRTISYSVLFVLSILIVFRVFPYYWGLLVVFIALLVLDYKALLKTDYCLILTFCAFFVFSGNMARIPQVQNFLGNLMKIDPLAFGILSCQFISNVPSAVLLSQFTTDYSRLLVAVNLGGLGTPIASLASLITLNSYNTAVPHDGKRYILMFLGINFAFLAVLTLVSYMQFWWIF